ncbi:unnamed protein product [Pocillopora meandrina]|uniref:Uncharacterized protein n=1 Tax=Pocillopora meandrina TaxID=46732 RepID=A0AAU9Y3V2_9CNID|nr:unnamed protein product [Pocillopora meandrina]
MNFFIGFAESEDEDENRESKRIGELEINDEELGKLCHRKQLFGCLLSLYLICCVELVCCDCVELPVQDQPSPSIVIAGPYVDHMQTTWCR